MAKKADIDPMLLSFLKNKAKHSPCTYKISGVAISKKGNILGHCTNNHSKWQVLEKTPIGRAGTAEHCERKLIQKFGNRIHTIIICRIGRSGIVIMHRPRGIGVGASCAVEKVVKLRLSVRKSETEVAEIH